jgi:hypothetical protein
LRLGATYCASSEYILARNSTGFFSFRPARWHRDAGCARGGSDPAPTDRQRLVQRAAGLITVWSCAIAVESCPLSATPPSASVPHGQACRTPNIAGFRWPRQIGRAA